MKIKELPEKFQFLIKDQDETFRLYADRKEIGVKVLESLKGKRKGVDAQGNEAEGFYLSDRNKEVGLLGQLYGLNAMFALSNRYGVAHSDEDKEGIKAGLKFVLDYLHENGGCYDLNPLLDADINGELFIDNNYHYVGAMTWALSLFVAARKAQRTGAIELSEEESNQLVKQIRAIIKFFVDNVVVKDGNPLGWGYTNGCKEPSLFFTYSVIEAFADFDDNVLNGGDLGRDEELLAAIDNAKNEEDKLVNRYKELCYTIGDRTWAMYKDVLKTDFLGDNFMERKLISRDEILNSSRSSVLFNTLYVIFILFYSYTNVRNEKEGEEIVNSMNLALQMIQNFYDELRSMGRESIVDRHIIAFDEAHEIKGFGRVLNDESIQASPFLPMLAKANNLIAYYILEFPQQQMREMFDMMLEAQMPGKKDWLWDKRKFDLLSTERYLESIADFFDYYDKYERSYADKSTTDTKRRQEIRQELEPAVERRMAKTLEARHKKELANALQEAEKQHPIELAINERIDKKVEERAMGMLIESIEKIVAYNWAEESEKKKMEFTPTQKQLKDSMEKLVFSYLADDIRIKAMAANEMEASALASAVQGDVGKFMAAFVEFIAQNNANKPEDKKQSLAEVFKLIKN